MHVDVCVRCHGATRITEQSWINRGGDLSVSMRRVRCERCDGSGFVDPATAEQVVAP